MSKRTSAQKKPVAARNESETTSIKSNPLVFISHDHRDAEIAEAFSTLLSKVSMGMLRSFRSSDRSGVSGIEYGTEWYQKVMESLANSDAVVCLLTERSIERPWILYEAGVAKGKLNTPVNGIAIGVPLSQASRGPFAQFQNCADDPESLRGLVLQLARMIDGAVPDTDHIDAQVAIFKNRVTELLERQLKSTAIIEQDNDVSARMFEEVKIMFKSIDTRLSSMSIPRTSSDPGVFQEFVGSKGRLSVRMQIVQLCEEFGILTNVKLLSPEEYRILSSKDVGFNEILLAYESLDGRLSGLKNDGLSKRESEIFASLRELTKRVLRTLKLRIR